MLGGGVMFLVKEDFIFHRKGSVLSEKMNMEETLLEEAIWNVYQVVEWGNLYFKGAGSVIIHLSDMPIVETVAFMGIEEVKKEVMIYLNITELLVSFLDGRYKDDYLFEKELTFANFVTFVLLHELGHINDAISASSEGTFIHKIEKYIRKVQKEYSEFREDNSELFDKKIKGNISADEDVFLKKMYREILSEKSADEFAKVYMKGILK